MERINLSINLCIVPSCDGSQPLAIWINQCLKVHDFVLVPLRTSYCSVHRREKVSLTGGPKICRFIDYVVKFKFINILSKSVGPKGDHGGPAYGSVYSYFHF